MASRHHPREQYLSPNRAKMPDVFVIHDHSVPSVCGPPSIQCSTSPTFGGFLSPGSVDSLNRRSNSTVSSIFDLSIESDQLERGLRENDANAVTKFLQVHYGKFPLSGHGSVNVSDRDRYSNESRSRRASSRASAQDTDLFFRKPSTTYSERSDLERRESVTPECDIPDIFRTSIHVAISHKSIDVIRVLLKFGIDPNEPTANLLNSERRPSYFHQDSNRLRPDCVIEETYEHYSSDDSSKTANCPSLSNNPSISTIKTTTTHETQNVILEKPKATFITCLANDLSYAQEELFKLPPLFIGVQEKSEGAVKLLLEAGADPNAQDRLGNSPLHLASTDTFYNVAICSALLRRGAKIKLANKQCETPFDMRQGLSELQTTVVKEMLSGKSSTFNLNKSTETLKIGGKRISWSSNSDSNSRSFGRAGSLKKKFFKRSETKEKERAARELRRNERLGSSSTGTGTDIHFDFSNASSHRSSCSRSRLLSTAVTEDFDSDTFLQVPVLFTTDGSSSDRSTGKSAISSNDRSTSGKSIGSRMSLRRGEKSKHRNSCAADSGDKSSLEETEKSLRALIKLAANPECVSSLVEGLGNYMKLVLARIEQIDSPLVEVAISNLFNTIIQTINDLLKESKIGDERLDHFYDLSRLLFIAFELLKGKQSLHFTAMITINRLIDICIVYRNYEVSSFTKSGDQASTSDLYRNSSPKRKSSHFPPEENAALNRHFSLSKKERRMSHDAHSKSEGHEKHTEDREDSKGSSISNCNQVLRTPLDILTSGDPSQILSILHNNITMHKRIIGTRQKCTPSTRWRQCTHHCLQILSARILTVMCHGPNVQHKLVNEGHAKTLVEALDPNHDPHLLCLLLQSLSSVALNPTYHQILSDADIADMLMQLLLPSDEWYYTNHSTKYAKYVKYHAARILVYLGQLHRLGGRVDLFDTKVFQDAVATNPILQVSSPDDSFIELMALGRIVMWNEKHHIEAASLEGLITHVIEEAILEDVEDRSLSPRISVSSSVQSCMAMKSHHDFTTPAVSPMCSVQTLNNVGHKTFQEFLFMTLPLIVHPVIILRLLAHKMFGNMIRRKTCRAPDTSLKPPKEENLIVEVKCPPRSNSESAKCYDQRLSNSRRGAKNSKTENPEQVRQNICSLSNTISNKHNASANNDKNGTNLALRAIGESLVTPLELNINSGSQPHANEHKPVCLTQSDSFKGSRSKLFKWQSKKQLSKSQVNIADMSMANEDVILMSVESELSSTHDVDIIAFQRELINLPTFVMDTPIDISPGFSRSSSVPENLASRLNPTSGSLCQLSTHSSRKRLSKSGCGSDQEVSAMIHGGSAVAITMTDVNHDSIFFLPSDTSTSATPDDSMANIIVHFDPPQSPLLSSASNSPQGFDFPPQPSFSQNFSSNNLLQPVMKSNNVAASSAASASSSGVTVRHGSVVDATLYSNDISETNVEMSDSKSSLLARPDLLRMSPIASPVNEMPIAHQAVLRVIETWINVCQSDLEATPLVVHEMRDFLKKLSVLGPEYKVWCQKTSTTLHLEEKGSSDESNESPDDAIHVQYKQLQELILTGELPCSKEEAATLAGIQLHLEDAWPENESANHNGPYRILDKKMTDHHKASSRKASSNEEKQECLRKKKELIRNNKARGITLSRRKGRLVRQLSCVSDNEPDTHVDINLAQYLPPLYTTSKKVKHLIEEKQKKLWHTPFYDSEVQLKRLYIKICKNLPGFACKLYHVKELLKGNTQKKVSRLLGISSEKVILLDNKSKILAKSQNICDLDEWRTGSGKSHDGLVLEFRGTKTWTLSMLSPDSLKSVTAVLWDALDNHGRFLNSSTLRRESFEFDFQRKQLTLCPDDEGCSKYTKELEGLQKILHFPEEVAVLLTETESRLFQSVAPADYVRQVTQDLSRGASVNTKISGVEDLIHRFNEVSTWITQLIITQPTHDNRKAVLSCILRLAQHCWCLGNFNSAMEILAGLKSEKLKPFWLLLSEEDLSTLHTLSAAMFSREPTAEYRDAVSAALDIRDCKVVPFFGGFLRDLRSIVMSSPSIVVLPTPDVDHSLEFMSDYNGEDRFMTRIGVGGLINLHKMKKAHAILTDIQLFQYHTNTIVHQGDSSNMPYSSEWTDDVFLDPCEHNESDTELDFESYQPIKQLSSGHDVMIITPSFARLSHQSLQFMNHGSTLVHLEEESGRACMCYLRLEADNATITWKKPNWSALRGNSSSLPDYVFRGDFDDSSIQAMFTRYCSGEVVYDSLEEGYLDITILKDVFWASDDDVDVSPISKRYGLDDISSEHNCICLTYGSSLAENKHLNFVGPTHVVKTWFQGLQTLCQAARKLHRQIDKRIHWLKLQYLQLYYDYEKCQGPTPAEAIRVFGGRRWSGPSANSLSDKDYTSSFKRTSSFVMGSNIFKKKASNSFQSTKESSPKPFQFRENSSASLGKRNKRSPSPQSRASHGNRQSIGSTTATNCDTVSETNVNIPSPKHGSLRSQSHPCTSSYLNRYRTRRRTSVIGKNTPGENKNNSITHSSRLSFFDFIDLFRSFALRSRKDLRDLFEQFAIVKPGGLKQGRQSTHSMTVEANILTRNTTYDLNHSTDAPYLQRRKICDAIAVASIFENCAGVDTSQNRCLGLKEFREFLEDYQEEHLDDSEINALVLRHEPDPILRENGYLSFEGFAKYLMDKNNYAYLFEKTKHNDEDMDHSLAHYYIASSHNTYLTSHQLKGDSSVELYSQILLTGCRCVELDCWDGDDGLPIIYHGHTLTTKISFKAVVEAINKSAFVMSPYPVILSLENHCSITQQQKMAQIFVTVFGDKLVTQFLFDTDFTDDPVLPSPNQLKYKILIKNKKIIEEGDQHATAKRASAFSRNYSMVLTGSGTSHEFDFEDDDDDEEDDVTDVKDSQRSVDSQESHTSPENDDKEQGMHASGSCGDLARRASCFFNEKSRPKSHPELDWDYDDTPESVKGIPKIKTKKASQIAKELSDLVVYLQAVKFRGLNVSPNTSMKQRYNKAGGGRRLHGGVSGTPPASLDRPDHNMNTNISLRQKRPDNTPSCYLVSSLNENKAKHLCRRNPNLVINEKQLMRTYPAGMRIDSSNFNPVLFWAFGIQMVALNYQTEDTAIAINTAMFEQNGQSGFVLKPAVTWDKSHVMYNHFNPLDKEFDGLHTTVLTLHVISGQYVCSNYTASTQVEVEIIGIPVDCAKHKTKVISRNALNPIWNDVFTFQVMYSELAFIRFFVTDTVTSHTVSQRSIPLKCLRPGYRHVRLRSNSNLPLELATIFIYSKHEEELLEPCGRQDYSQDSTSAILKSVFTRVKDLSDSKDGKDVHPVNPVGTKLKRRMFFISVFGVTAPDEYVILKVTQETSVYDAVAQALAKAGRSDEKVADHVLVEDVQNSWEKKEHERTSSQRILSMSEKVLQAQNKWKGAGKFLLRKVSTDPSSRALVITMLSKEQRRKIDGNRSPSGDWDKDEHMFHVCVYNVSPDQPYTIFKAPTSSTAQDIITQAMMKAHRSDQEDPRNFFLLEELDVQSDAHLSAGKKRDSERVLRRILAADESVYQAQGDWKTNGRFVLVDRDMVEFDQDMAFDKKKKNVHIKSQCLQPSPATTSLARKFCSKHKPEVQENVAATEDQSPLIPRTPTAGQEQATFSQPCNLALFPDYTLPTYKQPASPSPSTGQPSSKWKRILKLGKN